jgi:hypothetical protein
MRMINEQETIVEEQLENEGGMGIGGKGINVSRQCNVKLRLSAT